MLPRIIAARHLAMRLSMRETESVPVEINYQKSLDKMNLEWSDIVNAISVDRHAMESNWDRAADRAGDCSPETDVCVPLEPVSLCRGWRRRNTGGVYHP